MSIRPSRELSRRIAIKDDVCLRVAICLLLCLACSAPAPAPEIEVERTLVELEPAAAALVSAAVARTRYPVRYDGSYLSLDYPGGDPPAEVGVCTDVIVRVYRSAFGLDLQVEVHEDMRAEFSDYPRLWGLDRPDPNIDHRRVPNLETFLRRRGADLGLSDDPSSYRPGDLVSWRLPGNLPHIGIVVEGRSADGARPLIVHNVGAGPKLEDVLFAYERRGHFRFLPELD